MKSKSLEKKIEVITRLCLRKSDVMFLTGYKDTKARKIMKICREEFNGTVPARMEIDRAITTDSFLRFMGTNRKEYIESLLGEEIAQGNSYEKDL